MLSTLGSTLGCEFITHKLASFVRCGAFAHHTQPNVKNAEIRIFSYILFHLFSCLSECSKQDTR